MALRAAVSPLSTPITGWLTGKCKCSPRNPRRLHSPSCFFFTHPATTEIYTLSLHDALPISLLGAALRPLEVLIEVRRLVFFIDAHERDIEVVAREVEVVGIAAEERDRKLRCEHQAEDRKSTRLNSSHRTISYAVFCLKKKKK